MAMKASNLPVVEVRNCAGSCVDHSLLEAALAAVQAELPVVEKNRVAIIRTDDGEQVHAYADLAEITRQLLPLLGKHGLSFTAAPTQTKRGFGLKYSLSHESGGRIRGLYPLPSAMVAPAQLARAITYARRNVLTALTGIAPCEPDEPGRETGVAADLLDSVEPTPVVVPSRDFVVEARNASTRDEVTRIWHQAKAANVAAPVLAAIAHFGRGLAEAKAQA